MWSTPTLHVGPDQLDPRFNPSSPTPDRKPSNCHTQATVGGGVHFCRGLLLQSLGVTRASDPPVSSCDLKYFCDAARTFQYESATARQRCQSRPEKNAYQRAFFFFLVVSKSASNPATKLGVNPPPYPPTVARVHKP